jgi:hypothetical protein
LDEAQARALVDRLLRQGWDQGSHLKERIDLFLASTHLPTTRQGERAAAAASGAPAALVHEVTAGGPGMIVVSQRCDIVAHPDIEPLCEAVPLISWPAGRQLPMPNSARYFVVNAEARLVADQTRRVLFEKSLLPDRDAVNLLADPSQWRSFRAWCARRYSRVAFPDDFNLTIGRALRRAIERLGDGRPELQAVHSWRVYLEDSGGAVDVELLVPFDERSPAGVVAYVDEVVEKAKGFLPREQQWAAKRVGSGSHLRSFRIAGHLAVPMNKVSLRDIQESQPINFDDLTYGRGEMRGVEPFEEQLS